MKHTATAHKPRTTFYATTQIFEQNLSASAKLVLTYLSRVANREGVCFPSITRIAQNCNCCQNTVRKAITELYRAGLLNKEYTFSATRNGHIRQSANRYTLTFPPAKNEGSPLQQLNPPPAADAGEINNNSKDIIASETPSVCKGPTDPDLEEILDRLDLHLYEDQSFAEAIEHAIRTMYYADWITVKKQRIPQGAVRNVLHMLTIHHIDYVLRRLQTGSEDVISGDRYLISCLYNAPLDCMVHANRDPNLW